MPPRKRARTTDASASAPPVAADDPAVMLGGGAAMPTGLIQQREQRQFCDAEVLVGGSTFHAHRCVLALGSPYFKALYTSSLQTSGTLERVDAPSFAALLSWIYEGSCTLAQSGLVSLFSVADLLQVQALRDAVVAAIMERLSPDSAVGAWDLASRFSLPALERSARLECLKNFGALAATGTLGALSVERLGELLEDDNLRVQEEMLAFDGLVAWVDAQVMSPAERRTRVFITSECRRT